MNELKKLLFWCMRSLTLFLRGKNKLELFFMFKPVYWIILEKLNPGKAVVNGQKMLLDSEDRLRLSVFGVYEPYGTLLIKKLLKKNHVFVDIGAHIGYYTLLGARLVGARGKVYAFEPDKGRFSILMKNIRNNGYGNIIAENKAILNSGGRNKLLINYDNKMLSVESESLDEYLRLTTVNVIKSDTDGGEVLVLRGMQNLLKINKNLVLFLEFWPRGLKSFNTSAEQFIDILKRNNFNIYQIDEEKERLRKASYKNLLKSYTPENGRHVNLLCLKGKLRPRST